MGPSSPKQGLPEGLVRFISSVVPTYPAVELVVFLSRKPDRAWTSDDVAAVTPLAHLAPEAVGEYLAHFERSGILRRDPDGRFRYDPVSEELRAAVVSLVDAYDHRPVTLVRVVYSLATTKIQAFADSFKLKRD